MSDDRTFWWSKQKKKKKDLMMNPEKSGVMVLEWKEESTPEVSADGR